MRKYVIIDAGEVSSVDFNKVLETSKETLRYSLDNSKTFVKFEGETPDFLDGKQEYSHEEIIKILQSDEWAEEDE
jgi:hypothetical protein|tara:strand:- start:581 stop:805 length:225 start_codon:yes stop_codon:yes gene_type:complete